MKTKVSTLMNCANQVDRMIDNGVHGIFPLVQMGKAISCLQKRKACLRSRCCSNCRPGTDLRWFRSHLYKKKQSPKVNGIGSWRRCFIDHCTELLQQRAKKKSIRTTKTIAEVVDMPIGCFTIFLLEQGMLLHQRLSLVWHKSKISLVQKTLAATLPIF